MIFLKFTHFVADVCIPETKDGRGEIIKVTGSAAERLVR